MTTYKVGFFVGSLSSKSINRLLAKALARLAPPAACRDTATRPT
jgi:chromate reductase